MTAYLITAEDGVTPDAGTLSAALQIELAPGWKTYWKSPGEVGFPPEILWDGSENVASAEFFYPTPHRFTAFDIENYGYEDAVTFPLKVNLETPGAAVDLTANVTLLMCKDICVPESFALSLSIPQGDGVDLQAAGAIAAAAAQVPGTGADIGAQINGAYLDRDGQTLTILAQSAEPFGPVEIFPDLGLDAAFGPPEVKLSTGARSARISLPILSLPNIVETSAITLVTANGAAEFLPSLTQTPPPQAPSPQSLLWIIAIAFLGGLILNVMPCVLPVLSIKLTSALKAQDQSAARIRTGFLASALGVMAFMLSLAAILIAIRLSGGQIGWGIQFQSPVFLTLMAAIVTLFAANLLGLFEINLPQSWTTSMDGATRRSGLLGDFATGALAAILATPCSAPFLGTAVTFALAGTVLQTMLIFTALGLGLALPYLIVAARPSMVKALPKPGRWMEVIKWIMGGLLALTTLWLLSVLSIVSGLTVALAVAGLLALAILFIALRQKLPALVAGSGIAILAALALPVLVTPPTPLADTTTSRWQAFDRTQIASEVARGQIVFVDVTADWCLTCKTNKALVLDRDPVSDALAAQTVTPMRADWTRPNADILSYLQENDRFGIPFNIVYGPVAPQGIALPEILTRSAVLEALNAAGG